MNSQNSTPTICLIGDGGTGKTTWLTRIRTSDWAKEYKPTQATVTTTYKDICTIRDVPGQNRPVDKDAMTGVDAFIVFCSADSRISQRNVKQWIDAGLQYSPDAKVVVVVNKCDIKVPKIPKTICGHRTVHISVKSYLNWDRPIHLARG